VFSFARVHAQIGDELRPKLITANLHLSERDERRVRAWVHTQWLIDRVYGAVEMLLDEFSRRTSTGFVSERTDRFACISLKWQANHPVQRDFASIYDRYWQLIQIHLTAQRYLKRIEKQHQNSIDIYIKYFWVPMIHYYISSINISTNKYLSGKTDLHV